MKEISLAVSVVLILGAIDSGYDGGSAELRLTVFCSTWGPGSHLPYFDGYRARRTQESLRPRQPPPAPASRGPAISEPPPQKARQLIGITEGELRELERYLPLGAQIYTYDVGRGNLAAALISMDLDRDGRSETIVLYNERKPSLREGSLPLTLSVLKKKGDTLKSVVSMRFGGGVLFRVRVDGIISHFVARDLTGDGRPEVIVAPGTGASVGAWLEILSFDGKSLRELGSIEGHFFRIASSRPGRASFIKARSRYEEQERTYVWNGRSFDRVDTR